MTIEHYGPVYAATSAAPLVIQHINCNDPTPAWSSDLSANFDFVVSTSSTTLIRTVTATPKNPGYTWHEGFYRMSPASSVLKCAHVDGNPAVVYEYTSSTTPSCASSGALDDHFPVHVISGIGGMLMAMDMDDSGWIDSPDVMAWISDPQDFDGDEVADSNDLLTLIVHIGQQVPE